MHITDVTPYRLYLDHFDLTPEEELELVNAIWVLGRQVLDHHIGLYSSTSLSTPATQILTQNQQLN